MANEYDIGAAFAEIENELIASMIRNMDRHRAEEDEEGILWSQWQTEQLRTLEEYKVRNQKKYGKQFQSINKRIEELLKIAHENGNMDQEAEILEAIKNGFHGYRRSSHTLQAEFFRLNERKLNVLMQATIDDMKKAETAVLRMANDQYRKAIFNAQVYANTGAGTYEKAVDMATKDMLSRGLTCIEYANGARHTLADYADMAIRTASKRAYLQGEGQKRKEWGITTVIMNKRGNPCPKCLPFVGKVLIDDVWSGGKKNDGPYPLMSTAIAAGLYHPRCRDSHTTYFPGISTPPDDKFSPKELEDIKNQHSQEIKQQYAERQTEKYGRLEKYSLDEDNKRVYGKRTEEWREQCQKYNIASGSTNTWSQKAKDGLSADEMALSGRQTETAVVYDHQGRFLFQKRGSSNEVTFSVGEFLKLKGTVVTHNHPSGNSFSAQDISLLKRGKLAELRVITETGAYFMRPPKQWPKEIDSLDKIRGIKQEIQKEVARKYQRLYNSGMIDKMQRSQLASDEVMRIFTERYGFEYGWEAFEDQH